VLPDAAVDWVAAGSLGPLAPPRSPFRLADTALRLAFADVVVRMLPRLAESKRRRVRRDGAHLDRVPGFVRCGSSSRAVRHEAARHARYRRPHTLACSGVEGLETIETRDGRAAADRVLRQVAAVLRANLRETDAAARIDAGEIAILLPETDPRAASGVRRKLRNRLAAESPAAGTPAESASRPRCRRRPTWTSPHRLVARASASSRRAPSVPAATAGNRRSAPMADPGPRLSEMASGAAAMGCRGPARSSGCAPAPELGDNILVGDPWRIEQPFGNKGDPRHHRHEVRDTCDHLLYG
jgi:diguanylate cyclase (GGDEF)-like protein